MNQQTASLYTEYNTFKSYENDDSLMQRISKSLLNLGFNPKLKGYIYTKEAICICVKNPFIESIVAEVYSKIARKYGVTAGSVERAIRKSIECLWYKDSINCCHELFQCSYIQTMHHPTNSEFIATMAELIRL